MLTPCIKFKILGIPVTGAVDAHLVVMVLYVIYSIMSLLL